MELKTLLITFISVIIGIALISSIADMTWSNQNTFTATNDRIDVKSMRAVNGNCTSSPTFSLARTYVRGVTSARWDNATGADGNNLLTYGTDYVIDEDAGTFHFVDTVKCKNAQQTNYTNWTYAYGENYVENSTSRTILSLIVLFFAIGIVLAAVIYVRSSGLL